MNHDLRFPTAARYGGHPASAPSGTLPRRTLGVAIAFALALASASAWAQEAPAEDDDTRDTSQSSAGTAAGELETVHVTAAEIGKQALGSSVITATDLERRPPATICRKSCARCRAST